MMNIPENESDLQEYVDNRIPEGLHLDYKESEALNLRGLSLDKKRFDISKDVSAFANSDGGLLIYGVTEKETFPESIDTGVSASNLKEQLEQIIDSKISPKIIGLKINRIQLSNGNFAYVIGVPKSPDAPHQSSDKKYYKRSNSQSIPMEHYEIEDVRNRSHLVLPLVNIDLEIKQGVLVKFVISNQGDWTAEKIRFSMPDSMRNQWIKDNRCLPPIFSRGLTSLRPQKTHKFFYGSYQDLFKNEELKKTFIEVRYFHPQIRSEKVERFDFDFEDFLYTSGGKSDIEELREALRENLGKINDNLKKLSDNVEFIAGNIGQLAKLKSALSNYFVGNEPNLVLYEYDCRVMDVINSSYSLFEQNLSRFIYFINNDKNISEKLAILPQVDFEVWYEAAKSTRSGMVGSGRLDFPENNLERLSLLKTLFKEMATGKTSYIEVSYHFMYVSGKFDNCIAEVVRLLFVPFARDIRSFLVNATWYDPDEALKRGSFV